MQDDADVISYHDDGGHNINMDIDCTVNFSIKTTLDEAIEEGQKYQEENEDLRWNLSNKWEVLRF
ncbi:hypothetical protein OAA67_00035 [Winogradskyella sp.]|nr:hypothetical protein [Winogradskyella sp.]